MALWIRRDGSILCAAMYSDELGDIYLDDTIHEHLSLVTKVLVTESHESHSVRGEWWWINAIPSGVIIDPFYLQ